MGCNLQWDWDPWFKDMYLKVPQKDIINYIFGIFNNGITKKFHKNCIQKPGKNGVVNYFLKLNLELDVNF